MDKNTIEQYESQIQRNHECLLSSFLKREGFSYSNIFHNVGDKALGQAMYDVLKDLAMISKLSWELGKNDFYEWINEAFEELGIDD